MFVLDALDQARCKEPNKNCRLTAIFFAQYIKIPMHIKIYASVFLFFIFLLYEQCYE